MCEQCGPEAIHHEVEERTAMSRWEKAKNSLGVAAVSGAEALPVAEVGTICGCGTCGVCKGTFVVGSVVSAAKYVRNIFRRSGQEEPMPAAPEL